METFAKQHKHIIIGGSTKCGTTSLFHYLSDHPSICSSVIKETRFFWSGEYSLPKQKLNQNEVISYSDFFRNCVSGQWKLEATPDYLYSSEVAQKIKAEIPDCRFIFILREPVERITSWFKYGKQLGYIPRDCVLDDYVKLLFEAGSTTTFQHLQALEQGRYAKYLNTYIQLFSEKNVLITFYKSLKLEPVVFMRDICEFLEIDSFYYDTFDFKIYNPSINVKSSSQYLKYARFKKSLRTYNNKFPKTIRNIFRKLLKPLDVFYLKNRSAEWKEINLSSVHRQNLTRYYEDDLRLLEKIIQKKVSW